jgi:hypothetical protein
MCSRQTKCSVLSAGSGSASTELRNDCGGLSDTLGASASVALRTMQPVPTSEHGRHRAARPILSILATYKGSKQTESRTSRARAGCHLHLHLHLHLCPISGKPDTLPWLS